MRGRFGASFAIRHGEIPLSSIVLNGLSKQSCRGFNMQNRNSAWCDIEDTHLLACHTLAHSMPWFGHTVQNRDTARDVWKTPLHFSNGPFSCQWSRIRGSAVNMATDDECVRVAHEYARLAGLTKHQNVRDQLLDLARGWTAVAQHERRSDARVLHFTPATTSPETQQRSRRQSKLPISRSRDMTLSPHWFAPRRVRD